jgi:signal transduction histidine kinase
MGTRRKTSLIRGLAIALALALDWPAISVAQDRQKQVLVLYSTRRDAQIVVVGDRELPGLLDRGLAASVDYYSEFIDQARFSEIDYELAFRDFLRLKYQGHAFDVVIAMGDLPLQFLAHHRATLFAGTPVVFFANQPSPPPLANSTGVISEYDFGGTIALASQLQPDIRNVFVIAGDAGANQTIKAAARAQFQSFEPRLAFTYLVGLPANELEARLAALPPHSIVYYLVVDRDRLNENYNPNEYLARVTAVANRPVYCWVDSAMDRGIVGGSLKSQVAQAQAVGELAVRILRGEQAERIPVAEVNLNVNQVDWRQLQRWGISEARVPAGTLVRFREASIWNRYRGYVLVAAALLLAQTALIAGLLLQRARRRAAEAAVRGSKAALGLSYERIRDLGGRLLSAQESERSRIARELHDDFGQQLALLSIDLERLGLGHQPHPDAGEITARALERVHALARSLRTLSHRLHPAKLQIVGLVPALASLQRELSHPDIAVTFSHENVPPALPNALTLCLYRVVQEGVQNAIKHSVARQVSVHLSGTGNRIELVIADDGVGFDADTEVGKGLGLISMAERLETLGGTLKIRSRPGAGTRLVVTVPIAAAEQVGAAV